MIEEIDCQHTPLGELVLRRRTEPLLRNLEIHEVRLGEEFLMSSLFTEGEKQLADLALEGLGDDLEVVVGGLGLGYTAAAALDHAGVASLLVIDLFPAVIEWHQKGLVPLGTRLADDARCEMRAGDFFALARTGFDPHTPGRRFDAVLLDIDHSPSHHLDEGNESFYDREGLENLREQLKEGGVFGLWSNDPPDERFTSLLREIFAGAEAHTVEFPNPYTNSKAVNSVYTART